MEDHPSPQPSIRRFVYRAALPDATLDHPLRRATDATRPFQIIFGQLSHRAQLLKFRVCLKVN